MLENVFRSFVEASRVVMVQAQHAEASQSCRKLELNAATFETEMNTRYYHLFVVTLLFCCVVVKLTGSFELKVYSQWRMKLRKHWK